MLPGFRIEDRDGIVSITAPTGETIGGPGKIVVIDVAEELTANDLLTPAAAALIALGTLPQTTSRIVDPEGRVIAEV